MLRLLIVVGLTIVIALGVLVRPLRELPLGSPTPELVGSAPTETLPPSSTPEVQAVAVLTSTPTQIRTRTPWPTPTPSVVPSLTAQPTATPSVGPSPSPVSNPTATPRETPVSEATVAVQATNRASLAGRIQQGVYLSQITGKEEPYRVYLPPGYEQGDRRYPVLYLLHGWPYDENHWDDLGVDEVADQRVVEGTLKPFIIVLPGGDEGGLYITTSGGVGSFEEQLVNELMPHIDATFRSVQTREARAIGGISRGGVWALEIAFRHPDAFGIVGAHSPALSANRAPSIFDPFTLMNEPGVEGLRIYLSAGDVDWARQATVAFHRALDERGIAHQLAIHAGAHRDQLWRQHLDEYLAFYAAGW